MDGLPCSNVLTWIPAIGICPCKVALTGTGAAGSCGDAGTGGAPWPKTGGKDASVSSSSGLYPDGAVVGRPPMYGGGGGSVRTPAIGDNCGLSTVVGTVPVSAYRMLIGYSP